MYLLRSSLAALLVLALVSVFPAEAGAYRVQVVAETGVGEQELLDAESAAMKTVAFFAARDVPLSHDVRIVLVCGQDAYVKASMKEHRAGRTEAERRASTTRAWSQGSIIIQNTAHRTLAAPVERLFSISHEMVHQYQVVNPGSRQMMWLLEGAADVIAVHVIGADAGRFRESRLKSVTNIKDYPALQELRSSRQWYAALDEHGSEAIYRIADLAAIELADKYGFGSLAGFHRELAVSGNAETAFAKAFGISLARYEKHFGYALRREAAPR